MTKKFNIFTNFFLRRGVFSCAIPGNNRYQLHHSDRIVPFYFFIDYFTLPLIKSLYSTTEYGVKRALSRKINFLLLILINGYKYSR